MGLRAASGLGPFGFWVWLAWSLFGLEAFWAGFDQEAAAVLMARYAVFKCENEVGLKGNCTPSGNTCIGGNGPQTL